MEQEKLEEAKRLYKTANADQRYILERLFPELTESEDEKIREKVIDVLKLNVRGAETQMQASRGIDRTFEVYACNKVISWLEKQGTPAKLSEEEQNRFAKGVLTSCAMSFIDYLDAHKCEGKMCVSNGECVDIENAFHNAMWDRLHRYYCKYIEKQGEQKPWSEEGEAVLDALIRKLEGEDIYVSPYLAVECLKSIKDRVQHQSTWKPSEEQMHTLEHYMHTLTCTKYKEILFGLYSDLKKLMEDKV